MDAVDHLNVDVDHLNECHQLNLNVLELDLIRSPDDFKGAHAMFRAGTTIVTLVETGNADNWGKKGLDHLLDKAHIAFATDRETYESLLDELDGQFPNQGPYNWDDFEGFYFLDRDGNLLEVITYDSPPAGIERQLLTHDDVK